LLGKIWIVEEKSVQHSAAVMHRGHAYD
jgi:hypothetical protein